MEKSATVCSKEIRKALFKNAGYETRTGMDMAVGFLLFGPPGYRKTLIAKDVANEEGANFIHIKVQTDFLYAMFSKMAFAGGDGMEFGSRGPMNHHFNSPFPRPSFMGTSQPLTRFVAFAGYQSGGGSCGGSLYGHHTQLLGPVVGGLIGRGRFSVPSIMGPMGSGGYLEGGNEPYLTSLIVYVGMHMGYHQGIRYTMVVGCIMACRITAKDKNKILETYGGQL